MGRHLGLTDEEFWGATLAKVMALYEFAVNELGRKRDFFPAFLLSCKLSSKDKSFGVEDILEMQYPKSVGPTHDPDLGASFNSGLQSMFEGIDNES